VVRGAGARVAKPMPAARFARGDRVRVAARPGVVAAVHGRFRDPELLAYHKPGLPVRVLYKVRFQQGDLWQGYLGPAGDQLEADIYEHWLEPAT